MLSVLNLDDVSRADIRAMSALHALGDIDLGQIVNNDDRVCGALALAFHAADAACITDLVDSCALIMAGACDFDMLVIGNESDYILGAGFDASAAADTLFTVDLCNTVNDVHCAELASVSTVAEADAGEAAVHVALAAEQHCCLAVFRAGVIKALERMSFRAGAGNKSDLANSLAGGNAHDLRDLFGSGRACCNALVNGSFALCDCGSITVTAGEAAAAAVRAGQALTDLLLLWVNFDVEDLRCEREDRAEHSAENTENDNTVNY